MIATFWIDVGERTVRAPYDCSRYHALTQLLGTYLMSPWRVALGSTAIGKTMRFLERALWKTTIMSDEEMRKLDEDYEKLQKEEEERQIQLGQKPVKPKKKKKPNEQKFEYADDIADKIAKNATERYPEAKMCSPVFVCNDTYLEMRSGMMEPRRGFITMGTLIVWFYIAAFGYFAIDSLIIWMTTDNQHTKEFHRDDFFFSLALFLPVAFLYFKYGLKLTRLEAFTTRYLLVRFNRVTRQVYLHRSKDCGGVVVMPWDGVMHDYPPGECTMMIWQRQDGQYGFPFTFAGVGNATGDTEKLKAQWEWIRRYMDEGGLKNLEPPKRRTMFPMPWYGIATFAEGTESFLSKAGSLMIISVFMLTPLWIIISLMHWLSLMLCWRPRWPKIIREAGQAGKPVPPLTTVDDYPPETAARLKANAYRWLAKPGRDPNKMVNQS